MILTPSFGLVFGRGRLFLSVSPAQPAIQFQQSHQSHGIIAEAGLCESQPVTFTYFLFVLGSVSLLLGNNSG
jgi:hypothetical protein